MPNDDLTVGRCEALSDANWPFGRIFDPILDPMVGLVEKIKALEREKANIDRKLVVLRAIEKVAETDLAGAKAATEMALELLR